jgi:anti-anti-sigma factor
MTYDAGTPRSHYIELSGEYDIARKRELVELFAPIFNGNPVTIDMTDVTYVDSTFLGELMAMRLRLEDPQVTLVGVSPGIARLFAIASLDRFFIFR